MRYYQCDFKHQPINQVLVNRFFYPSSSHLSEWKAFARELTQAEQHLFNNTILICSCI